MLPIPPKLHAAIQRGSGGKKSYDLEKCHSSTKVGMKVDNKTEKTKNHGVHVKFQNGRHS